MMQCGGICIRSSISSSSVLLHESFPIKRQKLNIKSKNKITIHQLMIVKLQYLFVSFNICAELDSPNRIEETFTKCLNSNIILLLFMYSKGCGCHILFCVFFRSFWYVRKFFLKFCFGTRISSGVLYLVS